MSKGLILGLVAGAALVAGGVAYVSTTRKRRDSAPAAPAATADATVCREIAAVAERNRVRRAERAREAVRTAVREIAEERGTPSAMTPESVAITSDACVAGARSSFEITDRSTGKLVRFGTCAIVGSEECGHDYVIVFRDSEKYYLGWSALRDLDDITLICRQFRPLPEALTFGPAIAALEAAGVNIDTAEGIISTISRGLPVVQWTTEEKHRAIRHAQQRFLEHTEPHILREIQEVDDAIGEYVSGKKTPDAEFSRLERKLARLRTQAGLR